MVFLWFFPTLGFLGPGPSGHHPGRRLEDLPPAPRGGTEEWPRGDVRHHGLQLGAFRRGVPAPLRFGDAGGFWMDSTGDGSKPIKVSS